MEPPFGVKLNLDEFEPLAAMLFCQFAFLSVLVYLHSRETSSVVAQVLFQFKVRIKSIQTIQVGTDEKPRGILDVFLKE